MLHWARTHLDRAPKGRIGPSAWSDRKHGSHREAVELVAAVLPHDSDLAAFRLRPIFLGFDEAVDRGGADGEIDRRIGHQSKRIFTWLTLDLGPLSNILIPTREGDLKYAMTVMGRIELN